MLVTLNEMKSYLGVPLADTTKDAFLTVQINTISEAVEAYCRRKFKAANYRETFYQDRASIFPKNVMYLTHYPVIEITSFEDVYPATGGLVGVVTSDVEGYRLHKPSGRIMDFNHWAYFGRGNYLEVEYRAGYEQVPAPILNVVYALVQERFNKDKMGIDLNFGSDVQSINIPGTLNIAFDYTLNSNERSSTMGVVLGNYINILDYYRSDRAIMGNDKMLYVEEV